MDYRAICGDIRKREIVLYGTQDEIGGFIDAYNSVLQIKWIITDHKKDVKLQSYAHMGVKTILIEETELTEELIVVCDRRRFAASARRLEYFGKKEYRDYISKELVDALLYQKLLMVCMGTQLVEQVCLFLNNCSRLTDTYSVVYFAESNLLEPYMNCMQEYTHIGRVCDVYLRSACEKEIFPAKILRENVLKPDCKSITIADYGFGGYFPQIINNRDLYSDLLLRARMRRDMSYETLAFSRVDREIEGLCRTEKNIADIIERVMSEDYFSPEYVRDNFVKELQKFQELEQQDDIKLGGYIEEHQGECLCRNLNEWNEPVISYVLQQVLQLLDMQKIDITTEEKKRIIEENSGSEIPIYPAVQKAMGWDNVLQDKKYRVITYSSIRYLDVKEYITYLVNYLQKARQLMLFTGAEEIIQQRIQGED